jgi:hypothetical protein
MVMVVIDVFPLNVKTPHGLVSGEVLKESKAPTRERVLVSGGD